MENNEQLTLYQRVYLGLWTMRLGAVEKLTTTTKHAGGADIKFRVRYAPCAAPSIRQPKAI